MRSLTLLALAIAVSAGLAAQQSFPPDEDLRTMLCYLVEDQETPGIVLGIYEADGSSRTVSCGTGGPDTRPLGPRSVFEIGSINKTFTGILLALAVQRGEAALEDPVQRFLPDSVRVPMRSGRAITLVDLATHYSGLPRLADNQRPANMGDPYADYTIATMYAFLNGHELRRDPGAEGEYSNLGFGLLGHALARAAGMSYVDLVRTRILEPLGMTMTGYALEGEIAAWTTKGHRAGDVVPYWFATEAIHGAGGLRSSMEDMLRYLRANLHPPDDALGRAIRASHQFQRPVAGSASIGLGWQRRTLNGRTLIMHGGGTGGYSTNIAFEPERGIGIILLTNTTGFDDDLDRDFLMRGLPLAVADRSVPRATLERWVGAYQLTSGAALHLRLEADGWLTLQAPNNVRFRLYADNDSTFVVKRVPWRVAFSGDSIAFDVDGTIRRGVRTGRDSPPPAQVAGNAIPALTLSRAEAERYVGNYVLNLGERTLGLRVFIQGRGLAAQADGQGANQLRSVGDHTFVLEADTAIRLVFTMGDGGRAASVTLHQRGMTAAGARTGT